MTCIAWDGKTLAGDKMCTSDGLGLTITKVRRHENLLFAGAGNSSRIKEMLEWIIAGRDPEKLPSFQREADRSVVILLIEDGQPYLYEESHVPIKLEMPFMAIGSGRDYAMAAMHLGKSAREAVEIACIFDANSGNGIDVLESA